MNLITYLNNNSGAIQGINSSLIFLVTCAYSVATYYMFKEMKKVRLLTLTPEVQIRLDAIAHDHNQYELVLENVSNQIAYNIKFEVQPSDFIYYKDKKLNEIKLISKGLETCAVNEKRSICLIVIARGDINSDELEIKLSYNGLDKRKHNRIFHFDFDQYKGAINIIRKDQHDIAKALEDISKKIK